MATSDEQRAAAKRILDITSTRTYPREDLDLQDVMIVALAVAQQTPQERAQIDEPRAIKDAIHFANRLDDADRKGLAPPQNWTTVASGHIRLLAALVANPQQSNESGAGGGSSEIRKASITAREATHGGEHERSAYNREDAAVVSSAAPAPLSPNPQQISYRVAALRIGRTTTVSAGPLRSHHRPSSRQST